MRGPLFWCSVCCLCICYFCCRPRRRQRRETDVLY
uniref:Uncharacterized protein n=1 Tax=Picea sitchensis TaxID=3332 RepID=A9NQ77_PICSI|nr:unknown [Picea sitchensis]